MEVKAISKKPVIFSFRVTKIKPVKTEKEFKEWEELMQRRVGLNVDIRSMAMASGTTSCCPDCDDCDLAGQ